MAKVEQLEAKAAATVKPLKIPLPPVLLESYAPPVSTETGPGERYALGATPPQDRFGNEAGELPESYGTNMIFLTAREPGCLLASWDIAPAQQRRFNGISRDRHLILRLFEGDQVTHPVGEVHVHPESKHWLVHVDAEAPSHLVELGLYTREGDWLPVSKSAPLETALAVSLPMDTFVSIPTEVPIAQLLETTSEPVNAPATFASVANGKQPESEASPNAARKTRKASAKPSSQVRPTSDLPVLLAIHQLKEANPEALPTVTFTHHAPDQSQSLHLMAEETERAIRWQRVVGSMEVLGLDHLKGNVPDALERIGLLLPGSAANANLPTSPVMPPPNQRGFWFQVNAELIVYGATESDAKVRVAGQPVSLGPDGHFSFRFSFPDGTHHLPIEAQSADRAETRAVHLSFLRASDQTGNVATHPQDSGLKPPGVIHEQG